MRNSNATEKISPTWRMRHLTRQQTKLRDAESPSNRQTNGETIAAPERTTNTSITQVAETEIPLIVEIVATESHNKQERGTNSETELKVAVNREVDHRKGTLTITLETTAGFITVIVPVGIMIGALAGQITTRGLFWGRGGTAIRIKHDFGDV